MKHRELSQLLVDSRSDFKTNSYEIWSMRQPESAMKGSIQGCSHFVSSQSGFDRCATYLYQSSMLQRSNSTPPFWEQATGVFMF